MAQKTLMSLMARVLIVTEISSSNLSFLSKDRFSNSNFFSLSHVALL